MKYKALFFLTFILFPNFISAQTTYFIKYKESVSKSEIEQKVFSKQFVPPNLDFQVNAIVNSVNYLAKGIAKEDDVLGRIVKITFANSVDENSFLPVEISSGSYIEIRYPKGVILQLPAGTRLSTVKQLLSL